jgi:hypothetical protein
MTFQCSRFCATVRDVVSPICGIVREEEQLLVCICCVVFTRRYDQVLARKTLDSDLRETAVQ